MISGCEYGMCVYVEGGLTRERPVGLTDRFVAGLLVTAGRRRTTEDDGNYQRAKPQRWAAGREAAAPGEANDGTRTKRPTRQQISRTATRHNYRTGPSRIRSQRTLPVQMCSCPGRGPPVPRIPYLHTFLPSAYFLPFGQPASQPASQPARRPSPSPHRAVCRSLGHPRVRATATNQPTHQPTHAPLRTCCTRRSARCKPSTPCARSSNTRACCSTRAFRTSLVCWESLGAGAIQTIAAAGGGGQVEAGRGRSRPDGGRVWEG